VQPKIIALVLRNPHRLKDQSEQFSKANLMFETEQRRSFLSKEQLHI
jgi:hypothetical protein